MFNIGWSEFLVIGLVMLIVVGPKELPTMLRQIGRWTGQMRRMAHGFQSQFNAALREAETEIDLKEARKAITSGLGSLDSDLRKPLSAAVGTGGTIERAVGTRAASAPKAGTRTLREIDSADAAVAGGTAGSVSDVVPEGVGAEPPVRQSAVAEPRVGEPARAMGPNLPADSAAEPGEGGAPASLVPAAPGVPAPAAAAPVEAPLAFDQTVPREPVKDSVPE